ncbi:pyridine nucleotide-disulfide oxidoreductase-domain-containing protein [Podospora aff. communis PSN243]|uniref:Pyridine nucleotide-disulfide oxidoreductase-domain-containing protein n=1 Tax=Podospora aff. communis PSN243 TaxID=3040156 RepID=A0AAV9HAQ8_9PEZI|nr:pyridine nucleotide-disulfide oxidoreductase-domain-containing protein [Podospora aff. communis PSN243]
MASHGTSLALRPVARAASRIPCHLSRQHLGLVRRYSIATASNNKKTSGQKERVVILGSGWAGYAFANTLDPAKYERIVVSPRSYFVFTPLLASTAVGTLEFRSVLEPVRRLPGVKFYQGWADDIDFARKTVRAEANTADDLASKTIVLPAGSGNYPKPPGSKGETFDVPYDKLVIACGSYSQTFGVDGVREHAHFLRDIGDSRRIRLRVLSLFEQCAHQDAELADTTTQDAGAHRAGHLTDEDRRSLLHFAVVGGGPTGIEFAAELHDLIHDDLARIYPELIQFVRITVYDIAPKVLPMFDQALSKYATDHFARQGIHVRTKTSLSGIRLAQGDLGREHGGLTLTLADSNSSEILAGLVVWSTGLMPNPLISRLATKSFPLSPPSSGSSSLALDGKSHLLLTDPHLRARLNRPSDPNATLDDVFVIGDCAIMESQSHLPKTAQVASQQAVYLAKQLNARAVGKKPFKFRNWGTLTYLGGWKAIHQSSADELKGWVAWIVWRGAYLTKSMSVRNKIMVPFYWLTSWLFGRDISRF